MTDEHNPEAVAKMVARLRDDPALQDGGPDACALGAKAADMLKALAAEVEALKTDVRTYQDIVQDMTAERGALAAKLAEAEAEVQRREAERKLMSARISAQRKECRLLLSWSNAVQTTFYKCIAERQGLFARAEAAEAELSRLRTAQDAMVGAVIQEAAGVARDMQRACQENDAIGGTQAAWAIEQRILAMKEQPDAALVAQEEGKA